MSTRPLIKFDLYDTSAADDARYGMDNLASFCDISALKDSDRVYGNYATLETDCYRLDGACYDMPVSPHPDDFGIWSKTLSDETGKFVTPPLLSIDFGDVHTSVGITIVSYDGFYPKELQITWFSSNEIIAEKTFYPDSETFFCENQIENYTRVEILVTKTIKPYRYLKLKQIKFGKEMVWSDSIISAKLDEEINPISTEISINTLNFTVHDVTKDFNIINPKGAFKSLQQAQTLTVFENINSATVEMGAFYLDTWESLSESQIKFSCIDAIGILDKTNFKDGQVYDDITADVIISTIMESIGWAKYNVQEDLKRIKMSGWIPVCTHREALQQVAIALGAVIDTSRSDLINIYLPEDHIKSIIKIDRKFIGSKISINDYVTDVIVTSHAYTPGEQEQLHKATYSPGTYEIAFSEPCMDYNVTGATLTVDACNYITINVIAEGEVIVMGRKYIDNPSNYTQAVTTLPSGQYRNSVSLDKATLINRDNVKAITQNIFEYYQLRQQQSVRFVVEKERLIDNVAVESQFSQLTAGIIQSMSIDLAGGFIATTKICGANTLFKDYYYTGELYTGEEMCDG